MNPKNGRKLVVPAAVPEQKKRVCVYCGEPAKKIRRGEHVVPKALGCSVYLKDLSDAVVCNECNNGVLSELDQELCSRSFVSIVASQEIAGHLCQVWDVDHSADNLLVEAKPLWEDYELAKLVCYPQIVFERSGIQLRADAEEIEVFGVDDFRRVLIRSVRRAFLRYQRGEDSLTFERVNSDMTSQGYRIAPRIFTRLSIPELARKWNRSSFIVRYLTPDDQRFVLRELTRLTDDWRPNRYSQNPTSRLPSIAHFFDATTTVRALMKIGVNLLAAYCQTTDVGRDSFSDVIRAIRGESVPHKRLLTSCGFVHPAAIQTLNSDKGCHAFRLVHQRGGWTVYSSFFGGRIGAKVSFPGPNREEWNTLDVIAPIGAKSEHWKVKRSTLILPLDCRLEWDDLRRIVPSLKLQKVVSSIKVEIGPAKKRRR